MIDAQTVSYAFHRKDSPDAVAEGIGEALRLLGFNVHIEYCEDGAEMKISLPADACE